MMAAAQAPCVLWAEPLTPDANRFVADCNPRCSQQVFDVSGA